MNLKINSNYDLIVLSTKSRTKQISNNTQNKLVYK